MENNQILQNNCGEIISSQTMPLSSGVTITPVGITTFPLVAKIPVVIGEREIQIDVEAEFRLAEKYYEIKRIKKDVYLTQCKLLPTAGTITNGVPISGKLFISGYVRKNIEYATADCTEDKIASGRIAHTTIDVPFSAVTEIVYASPPVVGVRQAQTEIEYLSGCTCHACTETLLGKATCEQSFQDNVILNESPYCELEGVRIIEVDLNKDPIIVTNEDSKILSTPNVTTYNKVIEKMVIYIRIKVLQLQQVNIDPPDPVCPIIPCCHCCK